MEYFYGKRDEGKTLLNEEENEYDKKEMQANEFRCHDCTTQNDVINATATVEITKYLLEGQWYSIGECAETRANVVASPTITKPCFTEHARFF